MRSIMVVVSKNREQLPTVNHALFVHTNLKFSKFISKIDKDVYEHGRLDLD